MSSSFHKVFSARFKFCFIIIGTSLCRGWSCIPGEWATHWPSCSSKKILHRFSIVGCWIIPASVPPSWLPSTHTAAVILGMGLQGLLWLALCCQGTSLNSEGPWPIQLHIGTCAWPCHEVWGGHHSSRCRAHHIFPSFLPLLWAQVDPLADDWQINSHLLHH